MQNKLPKQWKHWLKSVQLKTYFAGKGKRSKWASYSLQGHNRYWRINDKGMFQVSCPLQEFDRWQIVSIVKLACQPQNNSYNKLLRSY